MIDNSLMFDESYIECPRCERDVKTWNYNDSLQLCYQCAAEYIKIEE